MSATRGSSAEAAPRRLRRSSSGAVALLLDQRPWLKPDQVKAILTSTADKLPNVPDRAEGAGMINLRRAQGENTPSLEDVTQTWDLATGLGSLNAARGTQILENDGMKLDGETDIFGQPWNGSAWTADMPGPASAWTGGVWNGSAWTGSAWTGSAWTGSAWTGSAWTGQCLDRECLDRECLDRAVPGRAVLGPAVLGPAVPGPGVLGPGVLGPAALGPAVLWTGSAWTGSAWSSAGWGISARFDERPTGYSRHGSS